MRRSLIRAAAVILAALLLCICVSAQSPDWDSLQVEESIPIYHASQFCADRLTGGYTLVRVGENQKLLIVPPQAEIPSGVPEDVCVLRQPLQRIYMVSSASMDYFRTLGCMDAIRMSSQKAESWYLPEARQAMEEGRILYAGKYSAPDYETILAQGCDLAVENTMIYHTPEVREQLEQLGIPVIVDLSGYESDPLGRMEWIRFYGLLMGLETEADAYYEQAISAVHDLMGGDSTGNTVAFFYITSTGTVNVRRSGDYVARAIAMAGGEYISFDGGTDESAMSTQTVNMESFYAGALRADVLIYNSTIDGEVFTMDQLLDKSPLLADFAAVKEGNVWCLGKNFYQEPLALGRLILDIHAVLSDPQCPEESLYFLHRVTR